MKNTHVSGTGQTNIATSCRKIFKKAVRLAVFPPVRFAVDRVMKSPRFRNYVRRQEWLRWEHERSLNLELQQFRTECGQLQLEKELLRQEYEAKFHEETQRLQQKLNAGFQCEQERLREELIAGFQQAQERIKGELQNQFQQEKEQYCWQRLRQDRFILSLRWWGGTPWYETRPQSKYVFIVGSGHSGTTIFLRILSDHPEIFGIPKETGLFLNASDTAILQGVLDWESQAKSAGKSIILEKTPDQLFSVHKINEFVPQNHIFCIIRDGRDVVASLMARGWELQRAMDCWRGHMEYLTEARAKCANLTVIKLEELIKEPQRVVKETLDIIGVESSEATVDYLLRYHERPVRYYYDKVELPENGLEGENQGKLRNYQIHQPLFKNTTRWRRDLSTEMQRELTEKLGYWLNEYGYLESDVQMCKAA